MAGEPAVAGPAVDITALFRRHYAELVRLVVMLVGDRPTAEDVVQDVFARLHARRDEPGPTGDHLAYVRACVLNECRSALRRRALLGRLARSRAPMPDLPNESAEHEVILAEGRREVLAALSALPRRRREVLVLRYYLGLREAEIAAVLGITPGTVKSTAARGPAAGPGRWGPWLAPLAAAASVVLVVVLVGALHLFSGRPPGGGGIDPPPRYYVTEESMGIQVRDTATGAVTARLPRPFSGPGYFGMFANVVAAGGGDREFVAEYTGSPPHSTVAQTRLYSFLVTSAGRVAGQALVKGGRLGHFIGGAALAVSPDGSQVATVVYHTVGNHGPRPVPQIVVINLRTGAHSFWTGGLQRAGLYLSIPSISWGPGGGLVFLGQWCHTWLLGEICGTGPHFSQVRTLRVAPGGGRLSDGSALLSQSARYSYLTQALLSPDGKALTVVALGPAGLAPGRSVPQNFRVVRVPLRGAGGGRLLYRGVLSDHPYVFLGSDASGRHLLLSWRLNGWIDHGRLRLLAPQGATPFTQAW